MRMPCLACGCDPCMEMPRCRYPYSHDGPAVYGSKLADYLISEANMEDDLKPALAAVWPTSPVPDPPADKARTLGCDGCDQRDAENARLREALEHIAAEREGPEPSSPLHVQIAAWETLCELHEETARAALGEGEG